MTDLSIVNKLVDMTLSEMKDCPEGYRWCKIQKKCVEDPEAKKGKGQGLHRGQGKGPMGKPFKKQNEMFAADMPEFEKVARKVDVIVDSSITECPESEPNAVKNIPSDDGNEEIDRVHYDIAGYNDPKDVEAEYPPGPPDDDRISDTDVDDENLLGNALESALNEKTTLNEKGEYQRFFKRMMDEEGITGIASMSPEQKSSFFKKVSAGWKKEKGKGVAETFSYIK